MSNHCHGYKGNGWVSPNGNNAVLCPVCEGQGVFARKAQPEPFVKEPFNIKPYTLPTNPYQPSPYFYEPTISCDGFSKDSVNKTAKVVMENIENSIRRQAKRIGSNVSM